MKLKELVESLRNPEKIRGFVRRHRTENQSHGKEISRVAGLLASEKWFMVGQGNYGTVFHNEQYPYIIKIFRKDANYMRWMEFARTHPDNPYVPRFRGGLTSISENFNVVRIELLDEITEKDHYRYLAFYNDLVIEKNVSADPHVNEIKKFLYSVVKDRYGLDISPYGDNVMLRGSQFVISDPFP